ncbi:MAG TPA: hypothetical protein VHV78_05745 [Gemmatimonadaceae bacterium]|nr:hypothetical protein [Gemmatimonadaceae bacterium]
MAIRAAAAVAAAALIMGVTACSGDDTPPPLREMSNTYSYTISPDDSPPHARQDIHYTIQVLDRNTRQPIENGEGQLFSSDSAGSKTWDTMAYGPEVGTYHAKLNFMIAGTWAVAIRFHRDSLHPLERIDWIQQVFDEKPSSVP